MFGRQASLRQRAQPPLAQIAMQNNRTQSNKLQRTSHSTEGGLHTSRFRPKGPPKGPPPPPKGPPNGPPPPNGSGPQQPGPLQPGGDCCCGLGLGTGDEEPPVEIAGEEEPELAGPAAGLAACAGLGLAAAAAGAALLVLSGREAEDTAGPRPSAAELC